MVLQVVLLFSKTIRSCSIKLMLFLSDDVVLIYDGCLNLHIHHNYYNWKVARPVKILDKFFSSIYSIHFLHMRLLVQKNLV